MPRALNECEKAEVIDRFFTLSRERFIRQGLRKTTLAELIEDAQIGKGTFYLFFPSKEHLFWAIAQREEQVFRHRLRNELDELNCGKEAIMTLLQSPLKKIDEHPFLRLLLEPDTILALSERMGLDRLHQDNQLDRAFFLDLAHDWKQRGLLRNDLEPIEVFECLAALFVVALHRHLLGDGESARATAAIAAALAARWSPG